MRKLVNVAVGSFFALGRVRLRGPLYLDEPTSRV
jgi:hypothetical protein